MHNQNMLRKNYERFKTMDNHLSREKNEFRKIKKLQTVTKVSEFNPGII